MDQWMEIKEMVLVYNYGKMDLHIKEIGYKINQMEKVDLLIKMAIHMMVNGKINKLKVKVLFIKQMVELYLETGKMTNKKVMVLNNGQMVLDMKVII